MVSLRAALSTPGVLAVGTVIAAVVLSLRARRFIDRPILEIDEAAIVYQDSAEKWQAIAILERELGSAETRSHLRAALDIRKRELEDRRLSRGGP